MRDFIIGFVLGTLLSLAFIGMLSVVAENFQH